MKMIITQFINRETKQVFKKVHSNNYNYVWRDKKGEIKEGISLWGAMADPKLEIKQVKFVQ